MSSLFDNSTSRNSINSNDRASYASLLSPSSHDTCNSSSHGLLHDIANSKNSLASGYDKNSESKSIPTFSRKLSNILSYSSLLFTWISPLIEKGGAITKENMLELPSNLTSARIYKNLIICWTYEEIKAKVNGECSNSDNHESNNLAKPRRLWRALHSLIFWEFWFCGFCRLISDCSVVLGSILIKKIIYSSQNNDMNTTLILAFLMTFNAIIQSLMLQQFIQGSFMCGSTVVSATTSAVYHAALSLRLHKLDPPRSLGEINNIQSKDSASLREFVVFFHNLWSCPLMILACVFLLIYLLGWAGLVCFILICLLLPLQSHISKKSKAIRKNVLTKSDKRMVLINEIIDGIWTVKLTGLCPFIYERICKIRQEELDVGWKSLLLEMINLIITKSGTLIITLITFAVYCAIEGSRNKIQADIAFAALSLIGIIGRPIQVIPKCISLYSEAMVSMERIESLINEGRKCNHNLLEYSTIAPYKNDGEYAVYGDDEWSEFSTLKPSQEKNEVSVAASIHVSMSDVTSLRYPNAVRMMENLSLSLQGPGLIVIIGSNGAGKTSLLLTLLNELKIIKGKASILPQHCNVAYCGHESWIINATVKENILLGRANNNKKVNEDAEIDSFDNCSSEDTKTIEYYESVLERCALLDDIKSWTHGDGTLIGEKGINISGGQKQRIALARALYSNAQVLLLDSVLSGLDVVSSNTVFHEGILPASLGRLVILTCNQKEILQHASRIVIMDHGKVLALGSYSELIQAGYDVGENMPSSGVKTKEKPKEKNNKIEDNSGGSIGGKKETGLKEDSISDSKGWQVYNKYFKAGGYVTALFAILLSLSAYFTGALADYQLANWTDGSYSVGRFLILYAILSFITVFLNFFRYFMQARFGLSASKTLHCQLLESILGAKFSFFHQTPSGRIISRFSLDFSTIDFSLPQNISSFFDSVLGILTGIGVVLLASPYYIIVVIPLTWKYLNIQAQYRPASKALKVLDSAAKGPLFSHFRETLCGLEVIRSYKMEAKLLSQYHVLLDQSIKTRLNWDAANRWLGIRLDLIGALIVSAAAFSLLLSSGSSSGSSSAGGTAGLILTYAVKATNSLSFAIRSSAALENMFTSAERVLDYIDIDQEITKRNDEIINSGRPLLLHDEIDLKNIYDNQKVEENNHHSDRLTGDIEMAISPLNGRRTIALSGERVTVRYKADLPPVLKNVSFQLKRGTLHGVCGKSGDGKSSLSLLIAQAFPSIEGGVLYIDNENVVNSSLCEYRARIAIYPQDSFIFSGKLRDYLDPRGEYSDTELSNLLVDLTKAIAVESDGSCSTSKAIHDAETTMLGSGLKSLSSSSSSPSSSPSSSLSSSSSSSSSFNLHNDMASGGSNLSAGEKQIVVLARAALSRATHVVVLDEITSNIDRASAGRALLVLKDRLVRTKNLAVLLIAHNLDDIIACDEVWVMKDGKIIETGTPQELINQNNSLFKEMWSVHHHH